MQNHINDALVEKLVAFKLSSATIIHEYFNKTHIIKLSMPEKGTNPKSCLADTKMYNDSIEDEISLISKVSILIAEIENIMTTEPMVILKGSVKLSCNLLLGSSVYNTVMNRNVLTIQ